MKRACRFAILFAIPMFMGCYTYQLVVQPESTSRNPVRLTLTDSGMVKLAAELGPSTEEVTGRLAADSANAYVVSVLRTRRRGGPDIDWRGEHVTVPRTLIAHASQRRFSRTRTVVASAGLIVAAIVARQAVWGPGGVFGGAPPGGGPAPR